jgi:signal transduction histidine kinase
MERVANRLWFRLTLVLLGIHAVLLPLLFYGLLVIVQRSLADVFLDEVRTYGRLLADELELGDALSSPARTLTLLDSVILSGQGVYAEVIEGQEHLRSALVSPGLRVPNGDDFVFGGRGDHTYYLSVPVTKGSRQVILRLGFDESGTDERIERARERIFMAVLLFTAASIGMAIWLATRIAQPLTHLQRAAQRIATGDSQSHLEVPSSIHEVRELARHLESMRSELVGTNDRLEREMADRAAAEAQRRSLEERLRHRERIASIGTLAGGIAHEFNNIMTPILLYTQMALDEVKDDTLLADDLRRVVASAHRARQLVTRILTFSREIGSGSSSPVRVGPVVDEVLGLLRAVVPANVEIIRGPGRDDPMIIGDAELIRQLTMNLCTNAYQAMQPAGGVLSVDLTRASQPLDPRVSPGDYLVLEVADTGHGMDEQTRARIFEPFFTTREVGQGSGLGLSVVHGIATGMGATILVDSEPGHGSRFRVYFRVPTAETAAHPSSPNPESTYAFHSDHR